MDDMDVGGPDAITGNTATAVKAKRAQMLAQMLQQQSMQASPTEVVSGHAIRVSPLQVLTQLGQGYGSRKFQERADTLNKQVSSEKQAAMAKALEDYMGQREVDPRRAAIGAASSPLPGLQHAGLSDLQALNREPKAAKPRGIQEIAVGNNLWQKFMQNPDGTVDMNSPVGEPYGSTPGATRINNNVSTGKTSSKYGEEFAKGTAEQDLKIKATAEEAPKALQNVANVRQLLKSPAFTGVGADYKLLGSKVLRALGAKDTGDVNANTELLRSVLGQNTLNAIQGAGLGTGQGFTDKDLQFLQQVSAGTINLTPETILRATDLQERTATASLNRWNKRVQSMPPSVLEELGLSQIDLQPQDIAPTMGVPAPQPAAPAGRAQPPAKVRSEAEYQSLPPGSLYLAPDGSTRRKK